MKSNVFTEPDEEADLVANSVLSENFFKFRGLSKEYEYLLDLKDEKAKMQIKYLTGKGNHWINQIRAKERQIVEQEEKLSKGMSLTDAKTFIEENMKVPLQMENITVEDFYSKLDYYGRKH